MPSATRATLRPRMQRSTLCDPQRFTRDLEEVYIRLREQAAEQQ